MSMNIDQLREERFQEGDGRCVFQVLLDNPIEKDFKFKLENNN